MAGQWGFWLVEERLAELSAQGDPLETLTATVDFEMFRPPPPPGSLGHLRRLVRWADGGDEMDDIERAEAAEAEASRAGAPAAPARERRMTAGREREAVLRLLRGEPLEVVAREVAVTAADLGAWRDAFLEAGEASLKTRARDGRDATIGRLRAKVGALTMDNELLHTKVERLEGGAPFAPRRSRR